MIMEQDRLRGSVIGTTALAVVLTWFYILLFLERTAEGLNTRYGIGLPSVWSIEFGFRWLRRWAAGVSRATDDRISPGGALLRLFAVPVGIPLLQHALNRAPRLPAARVVRRS